MNGKKEIKKILILNYRFIKVFTKTQGSLIFITFKKLLVAF